MSNTDLSNAYAKYNRARSSLLLIIAFSVINVVLLALNANVYFLFTATIPYYAAAMLQGVSATSGDNSFFVIGLIIAAINVGIYLLSYLFSKKKRGWLSVATILFILDSIALVFIALSNGIVDFLLDFLFHAVILWHLFTGSAGARNLVKSGITLESIAAAAATPATPAAPAATADNIAGGAAPAAQNDISAVQENNNTINL